MLHAMCWLRPSAWCVRVQAACEAKAHGVRLFGFLCLCLQRNTCCGQGCHCNAECLHPAFTWEVPACIHLLSKAVYGQPRCIREICSCQVGMQHHTARACTRGSAVDLAASTDLVVCLLVASTAWWPSVRISVQAVHYLHSVSDRCVGPIPKKSCTCLCGPTL